MRSVPPFSSEQQRLVDLGITRDSKVYLGEYGTSQWRVVNFYTLHTNTPSGGALIVMLDNGHQRRSVFSSEIWRVVP